MKVKSVPFFFHSDFALRVALRRPLRNPMESLREELAHIEGEDATGAPLEGAMDSMRPAASFRRQQLRFHDPEGGRGWIQQTRDAEGLTKRQRDKVRAPLEAYIDRPLKPERWENPSLPPYSVLPGDRVALHLSSEKPAQVRCAVYREGAEEATSLLDASFAAEPQEVRPGTWAAGCRWPAAGELTVPPEWASGVYRIELTADGADAAPVCVLLVVRSPTPGASSPLLMCLSTFTYVAYNNYGGHSLYGYSSQAENDEGKGWTQLLHRQGKGLQSTTVSCLRPGIGYGGTPEGRFTTWEKPFVEWCAKSGIPLEFCASEDIEGKDGPALLANYFPWR